MTAEVELEGMQERLSSTYQRLSGLVGKRVIVIGDSIDRNWVDELAGVVTSQAVFCTDVIFPQHQSDDKAYCAKVCTYPLIPEPAQVQAPTVGSSAFSMRCDSEDPAPFGRHRIDFVFSYGIFDEIANIPTRTPPFKLLDRLGIVEEWWGKRAARPYRKSVRFGSPEFRLLGHQVVS